MMRVLNPTLRLPQGLLTSLMSVGLLVSILVGNALSQDCTLKSGIAYAQCSQAPSQNLTPMPNVERAALDQEFQDIATRPRLLLASRGMRHDYGKHEFGERIPPAFNRLVQNQKFIPVLVLIGLLAIVLLGYRLVWYKPLVPVIVVARREIQGVVKSLGTVQSQEPVTVRSQRSGTIVKLHVAPGDKIIKGQILAELMPSALKNEGTAAPGDTLHVVASSGGVITTCNLAAGDEVYPGTPIFQITESDQILVTARISQVKGAQLRAGQKAMIKLGSGRELAGEVMQINKDPDPTVQQLEVQLKSQDLSDLPDLSVIGEEVAVFIATGRQTAPAVPISAATYRNDQYGVLVVDDGAANFRPISLGVQNGKWAAALDGVKEGELVMLTPESAKPGREVRAEVMTAAFMEE
jgi:multidrug efflux pump subunit AcrA (membrane-fusion protein)